MNYEKAESYFKNRDYNSAFTCFKQIAEDSKFDQVTRANSYTMMGVIIGGFADLDIEDESGIKYFRKALDMDPHNLGALLNVVTSFGNGISMHQDKLLFNSSYDLLMSEFLDRLTKEQVVEFKNKYELVNE